MEWLGLLTFALVVGLALPLAALGSLTSPPLGLAPLLAVAGLAFAVIYVATDAGRWTAWASAGAALAGALIVGFGASQLIGDETRVASAGQTPEEHAAGIAGIELPMFLACVFAMVLAAVGVTTV